MTRRLDDGLLLAPHLDAAFDRGSIAIDDSGVVLVCTRLDDNARRVLGLAALLSVRGSLAGLRAYLWWHRERVFQVTGRSEAVTGGEDFDRGK